MYILVVTLAVILLLLDIAMRFFTLQFRKHFREQQSLTRGDYAPKVCVFLPLRGSDPFLKRCLTALTKQNYDDYRVYVIVDNEEDPARKVVDEVLAETGSDKIQLDYLNVTSDSCSLRNLALVQAHANLPEDWEVIVQVDADAYPYPDWLSDLLAGLTVPGVGLACGFRWFSPIKPTLPNLTRHVWNSGGVIQMLAMDIGWGGSLAMTREAFEAADLNTKWGQCLFDDNVTTDAILKEGYKLQMVPRVAMMNEEDTGWKGVFVFIHRQLMNVGLYRSTFPLVAVYCLFSAIIHLGVLGTFIAALVTQNYTPAIIIGVAFAVYILSQASSLWISEAMIARTTQAAGRPTSRCSPYSLPLAIILAYIVFPYCLLKTLLTKEVTWRGITYRINGPFKIQRENYEPFRLSPDEESQSL